MAYKDWDDETITTGDYISASSWVEMATRLKTISPADGEVDATTLKLNGSEVTATAEEINILDGALITTTELNYLQGTTSNIQTQIDSKISSVNEDTAPSLGGNLNLNSHNIVLTNNSGNIISLSTDSAVSFSAYELGVLTSTGVKKANATDETYSSGMLVLALESISAGNSGNFLLMGVITNTSWSFTKGDILYVDTTDGVITTTKPSMSGNVVRIIGYALDTNQILFKPDNTYITLS